MSDYCLSCLDCGRRVRCHELDDKAATLQRRITNGCREAGGPSFGECNVAPGSLILNLGDYSVLNCPSCSAVISREEFARQVSSKLYRVCPMCGGRFTVDPMTKRRQFILKIIGLVSLLMTIGLAFFEQYWLVATLVSYFVLFTYIWWGNKHVYLVKSD